MERYGRTGAEWEALEAAGWEFLVSQARLGRTTSYTETNTVLSRRTGVREFDFDLDGERHAMGELLGQLSERSFSQVPLLMTRSGHASIRSLAEPARPGTEALAAGQQTDRTRRGRGSRGRRGGPGAIGAGARCVFRKLPACGVLAGHAGGHAWSPRLYRRPRNLPWIIWFPLRCATLLPGIKRYCGGEIRAV